MFEKRNHYDKCLKCLKLEKNQKFINLI
jgi:hypothetical protein